MAYGRPGRPSAERHFRMARLLNALSTTDLGRTREQLQKSMGLPLDNSGRRMFERDKKDLKAVGYDIRTTGGRGGERPRYVLHKIDARIRRTFDADERAQLLRAAKAAGLGQLFDDLDPQAVDEPDAPKARLHPHVKLAEHAVHYRCRISFRYRGRSREVHPYRVALEGGKWFLHAREDGGDIAKRFNLHDAADLSLSEPGTAEAAPDDSAPLPGGRDPMCWDRHPPIQAKIVVEGRDLPEVTSRLGCKGVVVGEPDAAGLVPVDVTVGNSEGFCALLFALGPRVRLVGPQSLRDGMREALQWAREGAR